MLLMDDRTAERERIFKTAQYLHGKLGLSIFPAHHPWEPPFPWVPDWDGEKHCGKRPAIRWTRLQTAPPTEEEVKAWWGGDGLFNICIPTGGYNGINAIDSDSEDALAWMIRELPETSARVTSSLPHRQHWFYRADPGREIRNTVRLNTTDGRLALDVRGTGGYVIGPSSRHKSGAIYTRTEGTKQWTAHGIGTLPTLPSSLSLTVEPPPPVPSIEKWFGQDEAKLARAEGWIKKRSPAVSGEGGDLQTFITAANLLQDFDLPEHYAWHLLCEWNMRCSPPWSERDLKYKFECAKRYGKHAQGQKLVDREAMDFSVADAIFSQLSTRQAARQDDQGTDAPSSPATGGSVLDELVSVDQVTASRPEFIIYPWLLRREICLLGGDGGMGKSMIATAITSALTGGYGIPGVTIEAQGPVLFFSAEDDIDTILKPRLDAAGADTRLVKAYPMHKQGFVFDAANMAKFEGYLAALKPVMVVIDPIVAFCEAGVDMAKANHVRTILDRLRRAAVEHGTCVLVVAHYNKSGDIYGSVDFKNRARSVLQVYRDPEDDRKMFVAHAKGNYAEKANAVGYQLEQVDPEDRLSCRLKWIAPRRSWTAQELQAAQVSDIDRAAIREAEDFLLQELVGGKVPTFDVNKAARNNAISSQVLGIARRRLGVEMFKSGFGQEAEWFYQLSRGEGDVNLEDAGVVPV